MYLFWSRYEKYAYFLMTQTCYIEGYLYTSISEMSSSNKSFTVQEP